jgi:thiol-disulfide isomerase/thioredoxin
MRSSSDSWMWAVVLGATALIVGLAVFKGRAGVEGLDGKEAPSLTLSLLDGNKQLRLGEERGRVVMLDFWATWCGPCRASMPVVQKIWRDYEQRGVELIAVNTDLPGANRDPTVREFLMQNRLQLTVALDDEQQRAQSAFGVASLPTLVVLDKAGKVAFSHVGMISSGAERELRAALDAALRVVN